MIQIIKENRPENTSDKFVRAFGNLAKEAENQLGTYNENNTLRDKYGVDLHNIQDPNTRQEILKQELQYGRAKKQAEASQKVNLSPNKSGNKSSKTPVSQNIENKRTLDRLDKNNEQLSNINRDIQGQRQYQDQNQENKFFPNNIGNEQGVGNAPQSQTEGIKERILTAEQLIEEGQRIAREQTEAGNPMTTEQGIDLAKYIQGLQKDYNEEVSEESKERQQSQRDYGDIAVAKVQKLFPEANDEELAYFKKVAERASEESTSEADIERKIAGEVRKFKNTLANVKKSLPARRIGSIIKSGFLGNDRESEKSKADIRLKLNPLLRDGLYDTARNLLSELGYHPEERESILSDLGEGAKKSLVNMPKYERKLIVPDGEIAPRNAPLDQYQSQQFKDNLLKTFNANPSSNLVLLRKEYEDKGIQWDEFKDALNDIVNSGKFPSKDGELNDDQFSQLDVLDNPPLNNLEKILHGLKLIGR